MDVINKTLLDHTEPSEQILPAEEIIAEAAEEIKPAELLQPTQILQKPQMNRDKNGRFGGRPRRKVFFNFHKKKSVDRDPSPTEQIEQTETSEPPEKWTECRLRRHARELFREKVRALAEDEKLFRLEARRHDNELRIAKAKQCKEQLIQQEALEKRSSVKVKEEQQADMDVQVKVELEVDIGPDEEQFQPLEHEKLTCKKRQKRRENKRDELHSLQRNEREKKARRVETEEEKSLRLERQEKRKRSRIAKKRSRIAKATQREEPLLQQDSLAELSLVKVEEEQQVDKNVKVEHEDDLGHYVEKSQPLEREKLTNKKRRKRRERLRGLQRNKRERKVRRAETEEEKSSRLERVRIATATRLANETEVERYLRLERLRMARLIRLATETEEEKSLRLERLDKRQRHRIAKATQREEPHLQHDGLAELSLVEINENQQLDTDVNTEREVNMCPDEEKTQSLEREKLTCKKRRKRRETNRQRFRRLQYSNTRKEKLRNETEDERALRLEPTRIARAMRLANETEEQRFVRLELIRMARLKRLATETEEEKSVRIESQRKATERRKLKLQNLRAARIQELLLQQMESPHFVVEMIEEDQKADIGDDFEIGKFIPKVLLHEGPSTESESPTKSSATPRDTQIKKETKFDVVSNLLHAICGKPHSQQHNRLQRFGNLCTSRSSNYILSTVVWHKLNGPTDFGIDENLIEPDPTNPTLTRITRMEIKAKKFCVDVSM